MPKLDKKLCFCLTKSAGRSPIRLIKVCIFNGSVPANIEDLLQIKRITIQIFSNISSVLAKMPFLINFGPIILK